MSILGLVFAGFCSCCPAEDGTPAVIDETCNWHGRGTVYEKRRRDEAIARVVNRG